jgi:peptidoglycan/xylan/chitin deacetylase (PgdA/CDA1 family)
MSPSQPATPIEGRPDLTDVVVALTFDDGPNVWTEPILNTLRAAGVRATFFVIGDAIPGIEKILARTAEEGHEVGNHTLRHPRLDLIEAREEIEREIVLTNSAIKEVIGTAPAVFRPPGFHHSPAVLEVVGACGFEWVVQASAWMDDYNRESPQEIVEAILSSVKPGAIIDLHDGRPPHEAPYGAGGTREDRWPTVAAVETIVPTLIEREYTFLTVSELLAL